MSPRRPDARAVALFWACALGAAGCYENVLTPFPPGTEPWDAENLAPYPTPTVDDPCPETITFADQPNYMRALSTHARACIHAPIETVWDAVRNPQTGRDPTSTNPPFAVFDAMPFPDEDCDGLYETQVHVDGIVAVDFRLCWRHVVAIEDSSGILLTATRWQKVWGTSALSRLEGSLVTHPLDEDPSITVLEYQYHLDAPLSDHGTIHNYLSVIYRRVRDVSHGLPIDMP